MISKGAILQSQKLHFVGTVKDLKSVFVGGVDALSSNLHE